MSLRLMPQTFIMQGLDYDVIKTGKVDDLVIIFFLSVRGNEMAQVEEYNAAIQLFTEAISLDPKDFR